MSYSLATIWYERQRFIPGVLAVSFSALLIALQAGLLIGLFSITSIPIDFTQADIWVGHPSVPSVDLGKPIPESWQAYIATMPEVERTEPFMQNFAYWMKPTGGTELCSIIGARLSDGSLGLMKELTPEDRSALSELGTVVVDEGEFWRLGITKVGDTAEVMDKRLRVVGVIRGFKSLAGPYIFCSLDTAKWVLRPPEGQATFLLARCCNPEDAQKVVDRLNAQHNVEGKQKMVAFTTPGFSFHSRWHWLTKTRAGVALGLAAALGLMVGAVVTSQTLYAATAASMREYAVLRALGIPRSRIAGAVLAQAFWVGVAGVLVALPLIFGLRELGKFASLKIDLYWWLVSAAALITMIMAMCSGWFALRSLRSIEPVTLLR